MLFRQLINSSNGSFKDYTDNIDNATSMLNQAILSIRAKKCNFAMHRFECLGFTMSLKWIKPAAKRLKLFLLLNS